MKWKKIKYFLKSLDWFEILQPFIFSLIIVVTGILILYNNNLFPEKTQKFVTYYFGIYIIYMFIATFVFGLISVAWFIKKEYHKFFRK